MSVERQVTRMVTFCLRWIRLREILGKRRVTQNVQGMDKREAACGANCQTTLVMRQLHRIRSAAEHDYDAGIARDETTAVQTLGVLHQSHGDKAPAAAAYYAAA